MIPFFIPLTLSKSVGAVSEFFIRRGSNERGGGRCSLIIKGGFAFILRYFRYFVGLRAVDGKGSSN